MSANNTHVKQVVDDFSNLITQKCSQHRYTTLFRVKPSTLGEKTQANPHKSFFSSEH
jgi:hypothetical protein